MAKKMTPEESAAILAQHQAPKGPVSATTVLKFQMGIPSDILGSQVTFAHGVKSTLEATALGIVMRSKGSGRKVLVPWANVKAAEFAKDEV